MTLKKKWYLMWISYVCPRLNVLNKVCISHDTDSVDWIGALLPTSQGASLSQG